jgi:hypothetical protein
VSVAQGAALRDAGMAAAESGEHAPDAEKVDAAITELCRRGHPWSANDLRPLLDDVHKPLIGARIRAARNRKEIRKVGTTQSDLPSTHAHDLKLWVPTSHSR